MSVSAPRVLFDFFPHLYTEGCVLSVSLVVMLWFMSLATIIYLTRVKTTGDIFCFAENIFTRLPPAVTDTTDGARVRIYTRAIRNDNNKTIDNCCGHTRRPRFVAKRFRYGRGGRTVIFWSVARFDREKKIKIVRDGKFVATSRLRAADGVWGGGGG